jgi:Arc/MetJ-type ribon-helix-helix transcriptional regulator
VIICFECSSRTKTIIDTMVQSGQYKNHSEAISSAIDNLAVLQEELSRKGLLVFESKDEPAPLSSEPKDEKAFKRNKIVRRSKEASVKKGPKSKALLPATPDRMPETFMLDGITESPPSPASPPGDVWAKGQEIPLERWIFGQYNKLLPAKVSCRAFAHLLHNKPDGIPLEEAALRISEEALILGSFLTRWDKENGTKRDDALSTAFPSSEREVEKSRLRYANQFVASVNKQGRVSGLLIDLKLINYTSGKSPHLKLTEAGWGLAKLPNPILDSKTLETTQKFTAEERSFLLDHISSSVPAEDFAYRAILAAVDAGADAPEKLDSALQRYVSQDASQTLTKSFLASQRSGTVSRMVDLELIMRKRDGVKVFYVVTDLGRQYVQDKVVPLQRRKHLE